MSMHLSRLGIDGVLLIAMAQLEVVRLSSGKSARSC